MAERYQNNSNKHKQHSNNDDSVRDPLEAARAENFSDRFVFVDGRRFIADLPNVILPHDALEATREYREHYIYKYVWQGLFSAPVRDALHVDDAKCLDVACGIGIWAVEMANDYPISTFVGIDIGHDFPDDEMKPPNVGFLSSCNLTESIPFPDGIFNYVHQKHLLIEFPIETWIKTVIPEMVRVTKPLGWIEVDDIEFECINMGPITKEFSKAFLQISEKLGFVNYPASQVVKQFVCAGLTNVEFCEKQIPVGSWGGQLGDLAFKDMEDMMISLRVVIQAQMGITEEDYFQRIKQMKNEVTEYKTIVMSYRVWAQRPCE